MELDNFIDEPSMRLGLSSGGNTVADNVQVFYICNVKYQRLSEQTGTAMAGGSPSFAIAGSKFAGCVRDNFRDF